MKITLYYATGKEVISNQGKARIRKALHDCGLGLWGFEAWWLHDVCQTAGKLGSWEPGVNCPRFDTTRNHGPYLILTWRQLQEATQVSETSSFSL
jgi:hypothetical protein